jgi:flagellar biosynthesis/type III secretory pathway protein FliH
MRNLSDTVESFTLGPFDDKPARTVRGDDFINMFGQETPDREYEDLAVEVAPEEAPEEAIDVEAEARKIFEDAFVQGEKAGHEMGLKKVEPLIRRLNNYIMELEGLKGDLRARTEKMSVELALIFAETIILRSCEEKKEIIAEMVRKAMDICEGKNDVVIRVRPDDAQHISSDGNTFLKIVPDDAIREPGFVIETSFGDIDGRLATQIDELRKRIYE